MFSMAGVQFTYNGCPVLEDVSFDVHPGQMLAILGVNGAGKSTLIKCMNGILKPCKGSVMVDNRNVHHMSRNRAAQYFGYVPQYREREDMLVFDAILLGRKPHIKWGVSGKDIIIVEDIIREMKLEALAFRPMSTLSGGEAQKVLIGRALATESRILLLDEPTSSLDMKNQLEIMHLLQKMVKTKGLLAVVSMHNLNLALRFADRFLMLKDGAVFSAIEGKDMTPEVIREVYGVEVSLELLGGHWVAVPVNEY